MILTRGSALKAFLFFFHNMALPGHLFVGKREGGGDSYRGLDLALSSATASAIKSSKSFISRTLAAAAGLTGLGAGPAAFDFDDDEDAGVEGIDASGTEEEGDDVVGGSEKEFSEFVTGSALEKDSRPFSKVSHCDLGSM